MTVRQRLAFASVIVSIASAAFAGTASAADKVKFGLLRVPQALFVGMEKGYFAEKGIEVEPVFFRSGAELVPSLSTGQIDLAATSPGAALYNALAQVVPIQFSGTSNTEYYGPMIPRIHKLLQEGKHEEATKLYWQLHPARKANQVANAYTLQTLFLHRMLWKFQGWLQGFNGGPMRQPTMRLNESHMNLLRQGLIKSGFTPTEAHNREFFVGRNPVASAAARSKAA